MEVEKRDLKDGTCNFCVPRYVNDERVLNYDFVYSITRSNASGLNALICPNCAEELRLKIRRNK